MREICKILLHGCSLATVQAELKDFGKEMDGRHPESLKCIGLVFAQTLQHHAHIQDGFHTFQLSQLGYRLQKKPKCDYNNSTETAHVVCKIPKVVALTQQKRL
ncbi:hypothetical protein ACB098_12G015600 [Castanea mollissima]